MRWLWIILLVIVSVVPSHALQAKEEIITPITTSNGGEVLFQGNGSAEHHYTIPNFHPLDVAIISFSMLDPVATQSYSMYMELKYDDGYNVSHTLDITGKEKYNWGLDLQTCDVGYFPYFQLEA